MEDFAKTTRQAYDTAVSVAGPNCPDGKPKTNTVTISGGLELCFPACPNPPATGAPPCNPAIGDLCVTNLGEYFCMMPDLNPVALNNSLPRMYVQKIPGANKSSSKLTAWFNRLDSFYHQQFRNIEKSQMVVFFNQFLNQDFDSREISRIVFEKARANPLTYIDQCASGMMTSCSRAYSDIQQCFPNCGQRPSWCDDVTSLCNPGAGLAMHCPNCCSGFISPPPSPPPCPTPPATPPPPPPPTPVMPVNCDAPPENPDDLMRWKLTCTDFCDVNPNLPACAGLPPINPYEPVVCPTPPAPQPELCETCAPGGNCLEMGYCLEPPCGSMSSLIFKQIIKLVVD